MDDKELDELEAIADMMNEAEIPTEDRYFYCIYCDKALPIKDGVIVHDNVYHPENVIFKDDETEQ